jgi:hypothetical protein
MGTFFPISLLITQLNYFRDKRVVFVGVFHSDGVNTLTRRIISAPVENRTQVIRSLG